MSSYKVINLTGNSVSVPSPIGRMLGPHKTAVVHGLPSSLSEAGLLSGVAKGLFRIVALDVEDAAQDTAIPVAPAAALTVHVDLSGSDEGIGLSNSPWLTLQHALDQVPEGFDGTLFIQMGAGTFASGVLNTRVKSTSRIIVIGDRSTAPDVDLTGAVFGFIDNARASSNVGAYAAIVTNDSHWVEHVTMPPPAIFGDLAFASVLPGASTSPNLSVITSDNTQPLAALRSYSTKIEESDLYQVGCSVPYQTIDFIGIDFGSVPMHASRVRFNGCRKDSPDNTTSTFSNCSGGMQMSKVSGRWSPLLTQSETGNTWGAILTEVTLNLMGSLGTIGINLSGIVQTNSHVADLIWARNNCQVNLSFCEFESGDGLFVNEGAILAITGFTNFTGVKVATAATNGFIKFIGANTANVSGAGFIASEGGKMVGVEATFAAATIGGQPAMVGGVASTIAGLPIDGGVGTGSTMA